MREKAKFRIPFIGVLLSVMAVFMFLSFNKIVSRAAEGDYLTFTAQEDSTISFSWKSGSNVQTSTDGGNTWSDYVAGTTINLTKNNSISFKANNIKTSFEKNFDITGKVSASGDVTSLTNSKGGDCELDDYCYWHLFTDCTGLTTAPSLPSTTLADYCYDCMFLRCTGLTTAPSLPATTLAEWCYYDMFSGCTGLTTAPELPATTLADDCYYEMFEYCTGLTTAPKLPATNLAGCCYCGMFWGCTGLTAAPELPATTLAGDCYCFMFYGCTGLTTAPELPATTLADYCYDRMFEDCTGLTTVPELPATTLAGWCYHGMFEGCTSLIIKSSGSGKEWSIPAAASSSVANASAWNSNMFGDTSSESDVTEPEPGVTYYIVSDTSLVKIESFVTRLYEVCLDREPDESGLNHWVELLESGQRTGIQIAYSFIFSDEFKEKNYCNNCYITYLYRAFMGREADEGGYAHWQEVLESGVQREEVFNRFAYSDEFRGICNDYGIILGEKVAVPTYGTVPTDTCAGCGAVDNITQFITRLYNVTLDRDPDDSGMAHWKELLTNHLISGTETARRFIFSTEYQGKNYPDDIYIEYLYNALMGRASDEAGKAHWQESLNNGLTREELFYKFAYSPEFENICAKYGIIWK